MLVAATLLPDVPSRSANITAGVGMIMLGYALICVFGPVNRARIGRLPQRPPDNNPDEGNQGHQQGTRVV